MELVLVELVLVKLLLVELLLALKWMVEGLAKMIQTESF